MFLHGPDLLIDTPEEIGFQLNRARIPEVRSCIYSHWHPDHVMGRCIWEMNQDFHNWPPQNRATDIYLPAQVAADFRRYLGVWDHFTFFEKQGLVRLVELADGESISLNGYAIEPFRLKQDFVYAFIVTHASTRVLLAPDELLGWEPPENAKDVDVAVLPMGVLEINPITKKRNIPQDHPVLKEEATFEQTLEMIRKMRPRRVVLTHIEEPDRVSIDELKTLEVELNMQGLPVQFAYDTMTIEL